MEFTNTILTAVQTITDAREATDNMATIAVDMIDARVTTLNEELAILTAARAELVTGMTKVTTTEVTPAQTDSEEAPVKVTKTKAPKAPKSTKRMSESDRRKARLAAARAAKAQQNGDTDTKTDNVVEFPTNGTRKSQIQALLLSGMTPSDVSDQLNAHISYVYTCRKALNA